MFIYTTEHECNECGAVCYDEHDEHTFLWTDRSTDTFYFCPNCSIENGIGLSGVDNSITVSEDVDYLLYKSFDRESQPCRGSELRCMECKLFHSCFIK